MMVVPVETEPTFSHGNPTLLFEGPYGSSTGFRFPSWDVSSDGQRLLMLKESPASARATHDTGLVLVQNWFEELTRLVPVN